MCLSGYGFLSDGMKFCTVVDHIFPCVFSHVADDTPRSLQKGAKSNILPLGTHLTTIIWKNGRPRSQHYVLITTSVSSKHFTKM